jgi:radical SAM superfamily enzyme YgiQ (UPF0313 family)
MKNENMLRTIRIVTGSHCPIGCKFCSSTNFLDFYGCRQPPMLLEPEQIIETTRKAILSHPTTTAIYYCDDNFVQSKSRVLKFAELLKDERLFDNISFFCLSRADTIDDEIITALKACNFKFIIFGIESFSEKMLLEMGKGISAPEPKNYMSQNIIKTIEKGITPLMNIILFYPTSRVYDIIETIESSIPLIEKGARLTVYSYLEVYPGSRVLNEGPFDYIYDLIYANEKIIELPKLILPKSNEVRMLAEKSLILRDSIVKDALTRYHWGGVIPHPLNGLALFLAIYKLLNLNTKKIESLIESLFSQKMPLILEDKNQSLKVTIHEE